jgi:hypothetical protein
MDKDKTDSRPLTVRFAEMVQEIQARDLEDMEEFMRGVLMLGSCILEVKNHGVLLLVENEETMRVIGLNVTEEEAGNITATALRQFSENLEVRDMRRRGETH